MEDRGRGIPIRCCCGEDVVLRTSKTNVRGHLFRWTDETMVEEMEDILPKIEKIEGSSLTLQKEVQSLE
ncbi:hypothetical protein AtEden1_Chr2g0227471 [Arabidopsis thaliana]